MLHRFSILLFLLLVAGAPLSAQTTATSALDALRLLPRGDGKRVARIVARDGAPVPERWHVLVHDPKAEGGLREYVVARGEVTASHEVSQFAESLRAGDVIGADAVKVDSDRAAKQAQQFAEANKLAVKTLHYELAKGTAGAPVWTVICLDSAGREVGQLVIHATRGTVVSHPGFTAEPTPLPPITPAPDEKPRPPAIAAPAPRATPAPKMASAPKATPVPVAVAVPVEPALAPAATPEPKKPGILNRVGSGLQKVFTTRGREKPPAE
jgi:hypothetical protein